jgi:cation diffusion facilitator family transporter
VLVVNIAFTAWEHYQAEHLDSDLLRADAGHTLSDVAVTLVVIAGWQLAAMGYAWVDTVFAVGVALFVFYLAFSLFKRSVPVLVDHYVVDPDELRAIVRPVVGVTTVTRVRSHQAGSTKSIEVVASVAADLTTTQSHAIADAIEEAVQKRYPDAEVSVHIEPEKE